MSLLADLTSPRAGERAAAGAVLVVPLGSTEQHGPHLPLGTDTDIAVAVCHGLAARRPEVVVGPAVPYGSSGEHDGFAGTLSIGRSALELLLVELGRSASRTFDRLFVVSGHGGNAEPLAAAVRRLRAEGRDVRAWLPGGYRDAHAGHAETSMQLALDATRVDLAAATAGNTAPIDTLLPDLIVGGVRAVSGNGVLGDPAGASAGDGQRLLDRLIDDATTFFVRAFPATVGQPT